MLRFIFVYESYSYFVCHHSKQLVKQLNKLRVRLMAGQFFFTAVKNPPVKKAMVVSVVHRIQFTLIRLLNIALILMEILKVYFTAWSNLTAVEYRPVKKLMVDFVVHHIKFSHIRPLNMVFIWIDIFIVSLPAGQFFNRGQKPLIWKGHGRFR